MFWGYLQSSTEFGSSLARIRLRLLHSPKPKYKLHSSSCSYCPHRNRFLCTWSSQLGLRSWPQPMHLQKGTGLALVDGGCHVGKPWARPTSIGFRSNFTSPSSHPGSRHQWLGICRKLLLRLKPWPNCVSWHAKVVCVFFTWLRW